MPKPRESLRDGGLQVAIWDNAKDGVARDNITIQKTYKNKDGEWKESKSFNKGEVEKLIGLLQQAVAKMN
jgi:hypothetical protein